MSIINWILIYILATCSEHCDTISAIVRQIYVVYLAGRNLKCMYGLRLSRLLLNLNRCTLHGHICYSRTAAG
jgi:hypothetical protein